VLAALLDDHEILPIKAGAKTGDYLITDSWLTEMPWQIGGFRVISPMSHSGCMVGTNDRGCPVFLTGPWIIFCFRGQKLIVPCCEA
jgi:hypothetical protein